MDEQSGLVVRLAQSDADLHACQRLRYDVFVRELGADGASVDHGQKLERDDYDSEFDHLMLVDTAAKGQPVVGVYRVLRDDQMKQIGRFYSEHEYDLDMLKSSGRRLLELGRSCVHPDYRGGTGLFLLWQGLADYVAQYQIDVLFGVASFQGTEIAPHAEALSLLFHQHLAPDDVRVRAQEEHYQDMNLVPPKDIDRLSVMRNMPPLIKAYLRLGGFVGDGAYVDHEFNTVDVFLIMDTDRMNARQRRMYQAG